MSWINDELPADWPSKGGEAQNNDSGLDFTTSRSSDSVIGPTVSIQPKTQEETPQWKEAIRPRPKAANEPHLTGIFDLPNLGGSDARNPQNMDDTSDFSSESPSTQSTSDHNEAPQGPISRRLKVFGRPDTYTNERLGNLLSSMGGNGSNGSREVHGSRSNLGVTSLTGGASGMTASHSTNGAGTANESDIDLANNLQNEGRKVLQGLAPYQPDLSAVQESSLDALEQQLTNNGTTQGTQEGRNSAPAHTRHDRSLSMVPPDAMDTTTSDSGARTLDSLHSSMSNWDTFGGTHAAGLPRLHKRSSKTLCGSGRSRKPDEDLSALAISEPLRPRQAGPGYATTSEQPSTSEAENLSQRQRQMSQSIRSSLNSRKSSAQYSAAFDVTPEPNVFSSRGAFRSPLASRQRSFSDQARPASLHTHHLREDRTVPSPKSTEACEPSIAVADISFSAAYERLARLLRERASTERLSEVDSLDLNNCELESMVGLDKFVPNLTTLFMNGNSIRSLEGLPSSVVHLDLSMNCMSPVNTFPTSFISTLILSNNELEDLEPLKNLRALCSLDVSDNKLRSLRGIRSLTALRSLNVSGNELRELNLNLGMLVELDASHNQISAVNLDTPLLESLDLEGNRVVALNEAMPNLRVLNIRSNNATVDFQGWSSLETVLFDGNKALQNLDAVAGNLATFSWEQPIKSDAGCRLEPKMLSSIRDLKLAGQQRGWQLGLDTTLVYAVQHLDLACCGIREVPPNIARMFPFLTSLNLAFNKLDDRCIECLKACTKLERLSLFSNRLNTKGQDLAAQLPHIRVLDTRAQRKKPQHLEAGVYASDLYGELMETNESTVISVKNEALQWLDGHWTTFSGRAQRHTTRPGFQSPLYPLSWEERQAEDRRRILDATTVDGTSLVGSITPTELLQAMYVHHWRELHGH